MLGILAIVSLVLGAFVAGGAAFDWELFFSDGHRDHDWVRTFGREGARGLLLILGAVLVLSGFIGEVFDTASKPVIASADRSDQTTIDNPDEPSRPEAMPATRSPATSGGASGNKSASTGGSPAGSASAPPPSFRPVTSGVEAKVGLQTMTIWDPEAVDEEGSTLVTLQYRFEPDFRARSDGVYFWIIESPSSTLEVRYDPELLQQEGQLTHLLRTPLATNGMLQSWSTYVLLEENERRRQVSNRLHIAAGAAIRSTPPTAP